MTVCGDNDGVPVQMRGLLRRLYRMHCIRLLSLRWRIINGAWACSLQRLWTAQIRLVCLKPLGPPQLPCPTKNALPKALVYTSPPFSAITVSVSTTEPAFPLSYTPTTFDRSSKFLPALVGGNAFRKVICRWPSTTRLLSNLGTSGIGVAAERA